MNRIIKTAVIAAIAGIGMVAVGGTALADAPPLDGTLTKNDNANTSDHASPIGQQSSAISQNGQFVSSRTSSKDDWANQKGRRSEIVQAELAKVGLGSQG